ncbi:MAG: hypothetical protein L0099_15925 [Acidobacteria bacterium]|nr:hypothetical protein [Acidobacteriota bacterium]
MRSSGSGSAIFGFVLCLGSAGYAQSGTPPQETSAAAPHSEGSSSQETAPEPLSDAPSHAQDDERTREEEHILHIVSTVDVTDPHYPVQPLTTGQKFELFANEAFDRFTFIKAGASAGIGQARDAPEGYGQGARGFVRRYGAAFASQVHSDFFTRFALPSLLGQDPRYFRKGQGPAGPRIGYAMSRVVVTQGDKGRRQFNFSQVLGNLFAAALTNAYYPEKERRAGRTFARAGRQLALGAGLNVLKEFGPQLRRKMFRKKTKETPATPSAPAPEETAPEKKSLTAGTSNQPPPL